MKIDNLLENEQQVSERPMGFVKQGLTKLGAKVLPGSYGAKMQGKLDTGHVANKMYKDYFTYLGRINQNASTENLAAFLKSNGIDKEIDINKVIGIQEAALSRGQLNKIFSNVAAALAGAPQRGNQSGAAPQQAQPAPQQTAPQQAQQPAKGGFGQTVKTAIGKAWNATKNAVQPAPQQQPTEPQGQQPAPQSGVQLDPGSQGGFKKSIAPQPTKQPLTWAQKRDKKWKDIAMAKKGIHTITPPGTKINEEILAKITEAAYTGKPITRELYAAAVKMLKENDTTFKEIGIKVLLRESTKHTVKLQKI